MSKLYCPECGEYLMAGDGECHDCRCGYRNTERPARYTDALRILALIAASVAAPVTDRSAIKPLAMSMAARRQAAHARRKTSNASREMR